jgi:hypothetical protein
METEERVLSVTGRQAAEMLKEVTKIFRLFSMFFNELDEKNYLMSSTVEIKCHFLMSDAFLITQSSF